MKNKFAECYCRHYIAQTENEIAETKKTLKQLQKRKKRYNDYKKFIEINKKNYLYTFINNYENGFEMPEMIITAVENIKC